MQAFDLALFQVPPSLAVHECRERLVTFLTWAWHIAKWPASFHVLFNQLHTGVYDSRPLLARYMCTCCKLPFCCSELYCTHAQLNPFYHPFYLEITHVRKIPGSLLYSVLQAMESWEQSYLWFMMVCANSVSDLSYSLQEELELCRRLEDLHRREKFLIAREAPHDTST